MSTRLRGGSPSPARESKGVIECSAGEPRPGKGRRRLINAALNDAFAPLSLFCAQVTLPCPSRVWRGNINACWEEERRPAPACTATLQALAFGRVQRSVRPQSVLLPTLYYFFFFEEINLVLLLLLPSPSKWQARQVYCFKLYCTCTTRRLTASGEASTCCCRPSLRHQRQIAARQHRKRLNQRAQELRQQNGKSLYGVHAQMKAEIFRVSLFMVLCFVSHLTMPPVKATTRKASFSDSWVVILSRRLNGDVDSFSAPNEI